MPKRRAKKSSLSKYYFFAGLILAALVFGKIVLKIFMQPADINELTPTTSNQTSPYLRTLIPLPSGKEQCYYQDIQCVKAPCDPILVCPVSTPKPTPSLVATPIPIPSSNPNISGLASFVSRSPCGSNHFLTISFSCRDGRMKEIANNTCTDVFTAINQAQLACQSTTTGGIAK